MINDSYILYILSTQYIFPWYCLILEEKRRAEIKNAIKKNPNKNKQKAKTQNKYGLDFDFWLWLDFVKISTLNW